ncbi:MAG: FecR domain-containing protein [Rhodoplanes sp.]|uniref:FecR family protein n=1 Tax=Rhodoplanes sp. TaxID=1968906 RepID=UPI0017B96808|nr:FecR domain-containing protein [Rhodoplanes sp.]NVO13588.1 FecR domain-containing protein [Rhodoplanes sp.]
MRNAHPVLDPVEREAVDWLERLTSGEMTPEDVATLKRWLARSRQHEAAFLDAKRLWHTAGVAGHALFEPDASFAGRLDVLGRRRKRTSRRAVLCGGGAVLTSACVYGMLDPPFRLWSSLSELRADYRTGTGEQRNVIFVGDVTINLNTQTSLAVRPTEGAEDRIELIAGEASFATPARAARSLVVLAADGRTIVQSGRFDVRFTAGVARSPVSVTCFEGAVRIERGPDVTDLQPGQRVRYDRSGLSEIAAVDPQVASEWQRGIVEFRGTPLGEAVDEINRYRPGRIILMNATLGQKQLSGRFRIDQMNEALLGLERAFGAKLQRLPGGIVLLS